MHVPLLEQALVLAPQAGETIILTVNDLLELCPIYPARDSAEWPRRQFFSRATVAVLMYAELYLTPRADQWA